MLNTYMANRSLSVSPGHAYEVKRFLYKFLCAVNWRVEFSSTLEYLNGIKLNKSPAYYNKQFFQIVKFLTYLDLPWAKKIEHPQTVQYTPMRVPEGQVSDALATFKGDLQMTALIHLGCDSGLRAEELYQLRIEDIDLIKRTIYVRHDPTNGQTTKTGIGRVSFFTNKTASILHKYIIEFNGQNQKKHLWNKITMERKFRQSPIRLKLLRKVFSSRWDRKGGQTSIKKILMGHSLRGDVDLIHYNYQSEEDLKRIYDKVMK